ncbi:hypothetical protein D3C78_1288320 [compost metagenome]
MDRTLRLRIFRQLRLIQPRRDAVNAHAVPSQQIGHKTLAQFQITEGVTAGRVEQASAEAQFAAGGDGCADFKRRSDLPGHDIHPAETAEQWHHGAAVFGHGQHRGFGAFFQQQRRQGADDNACRAQGNDRRALLIELTQGRAELMVTTIHVLDPLGQTVDQCIGIAMLDLARGCKAAITENDNRRNGTCHQPCHLSPGTMINEKYGEDIGST